MSSGLANCTVTFVHLDRERPSTRIRIVDLDPHLRRIGITVRLAPYGDWSALDAPGDVVVLQKKLPSFLGARRLRKLGVPIIFDFDDAVMFRDRPKKGSYVSPTRRRRFDRIVDIASGFAAGNDYLAEQLPPSGKPCAVIPSAVPHDVPRRVHSQGSELRIAWVGLSQNLRFLSALDEVWPCLAEHGVSVRLVVVSNESFETNACEVEWVPWSVTAQHDALATCDVGIMPLDLDSPWTRGKCSYKVLQYMAAELPVVASDVGMNREVILDGETGYLATSVATWVDALERLAHSVEDRRRLGLAGRERIEATMTYPVIAGLWAELLARVVSHAP